MLRPLSLLLSLLLLLWVGCDNTEPPVNEPDSEFDRAAMLESYANVVIAPALSRFRDEANALRTAAEAYTRSLSDTDWDNLQGTWTRVALAWQAVQAYNFGPGDLSRGTLFEQVGTWPVDVAKLAEYIAEGDTSLANFNQDTRGLLALDYLLFADNARPDLEADANRRAYLRAVARDIAAKANTVADGWENGYTDTFVENDGISAGSSTSLLYNNFVLSYERLKNFKVGVPAGLRAGQTEADPTLVEASYSGQSLVLMREQFDQTESLWEGRGATDGLGFKEYLRAVEGGEALIDETEEQIDACERAFEALPAGKTLAQLIEEDIAAVTNLHTELQKLTRFFKSEMSSRLSITITYDSGDGD